MNYPLHEGKHLQFLVSKYLKSTGKTAVELSEKLGMKASTHLYTIYGRISVKKPLLNRILSAIGLTLEEFYNSSPSDPAKLKNGVSTHHGQNLQNTITNSGVSITKLAEKMNITRTTLYNQFKERKIDDGFLLKAAQFLNVPVAQLKGYAVSERVFEQDIYNELVAINKKMDILINAKVK